VRIIFSICKLREVSKDRMAVRDIATDDSGLGNKMVMFIWPEALSLDGPVLIT
jgi:hypothetical protein